MRIVWLLLLAITFPAAGFARPVPALVPEGWAQELADPDTRTRRFVSGDGRSTLTTKQTVASRSNLVGDMDRIAFRQGEQITYQRRGRSWIAVSGYRGDAIFYRKSNVACGGTRWNHIELVYPRENKAAMDIPVTRIARGMTRYGGDCN
jgi:serine/threonine-protein kinase